MSATTKLTETPRQELDAVNPKLAQQFEQLIDLLARRLSPAHAHLFAEPVPVTTAGTGRAGLAWFAAVDGEAHAVMQLEPTAAEALRHAAARLTGEIARFADSLEREGEASRDLARLLRDALIVPDEDHLWSVDGQPVLVAWGYRHARADGMIADRAAAITASAVAPLIPAASKPVLRSAEPVAAAERRQPSRAVERSGSRVGRYAPVLWLLFALLCAILADRLLQACAVGDDSWPAWLRSVLPDHCPVASMILDPAETSVLAGIRAAEGEIHAAELALTRRALACDTSCPAPASGLRRAAVETLRPIPAEVEHRLEGIERGQGLELTLAWEGPADLDLQVICPDRTRIHFKQRAACGGRLVADQNRGGGTSTSRPVEHIIWDEAPTPGGRYAVEVSLYERHGELRPEVPFKVVLSRHGQIVQEGSGRISAARVGQGVLTFDTSLPASAGTVSVP
ncbi:hypothetical protein [Methylobacterium nigriterrae]|uniref:hypothetical protein n=1 Tax=Methylobacterium nigriterrae TaxID=3127512 RepID=UPI0030140A65